MVPTGNVLLGFDYDSIKRFLSEGYSYKSLIKDINTNNSELLLFNNEANPNFISFEHTLASDGEPGFKITFIDPNQEFEKRFLQGGMYARIAGTFYNKDVKSLTDPYGKDRNSKVATSLSKFDKSYYSELQDKLIENNRVKEIYVIYGVGKDLKFWAGPYKSFLSNIDISPTGGGARKLTITLTAAPTSIFPRLGAFNEEVNLNLAGMNIRCTGASQEVVLNNYPNAVYDSISNFQKAKKITNDFESFQSVDNNLLKEAGFERASSLVKGIDLHSMVVDAIRNYVQSATSNKNVIVLIPNINTAARAYIEHIADLVKFDSKAYRASKATQGTKMGSLQASMNNSLYDARNEELGKLEAYVRTFLYELGLSFDCIEKNKTSFVETIPSGPISFHADVEKSINYKKRFTGYFQHKFSAILSEANNKGLPDHVGKLKTIFDKLREITKGTYSINLKVLTETQLQVLDFWSEGDGIINPSEYPTFAGYDKFSEKCEAIIVGDEGLIDAYLYGNVTLDDKVNSINDLTFQLAEAQNQIKQAQEKARNLVGSPIPNKTVEEIKQISVPIKDANGNTIGFTFSGTELSGTFGRTSSQAASLDEQIKLIKELSEKSREIRASILDTVPLHPLDKIILLDNRYLKKIKKIITPPVLKGSNGFGNISFVPDEFAYTQFDNDEKIQQELNSKGIAVFRYNVENPNILDLNVKISEVYMGLLKLGYEKVITRKASTKVNSLLPEGIGSFPIDNIENAILFLKQKQFSTGMGIKERNDIIKNLMSKFDPTFVQTFADNDAGTAAATIAAILDTLEKVDYKQFIEIGEHKPTTPTDVLSEVFNDLYTKCTDVTIKTLPFFHISKTSDIVSTHCLVIAQDVPILKTNKPERTILNTFITSQYKIVGFKHVIDSTSGMHSEFNLTKQVAGLGEI